MREKRCKWCGQVRPIDEFPRHPMMADGHLNRCKRCFRKPGAVTGRPKGDDAERFWSKVEKTDGCWNWTGHTQRGYGVFSSAPERGKKKGWRAHRYAFLLVNGREPGPLLMHECDNRACVRIGDGHVVEGTQKENIAHAVATGRMNFGERNGSAKLTDALVIEIRERRASGETQQEIADDFGVSQVMVSLIVRGKKWPHAGGPIEGDAGPRTP